MVPTPARAWAPARPSETLVTPSRPVNGNRGRTPSGDGRSSRGPAAVGIYFVRYSVAGKSFTRRLALVR